MAAPSQSLDKTAGIATVPPIEWLNEEAKGRFLISRCAVIQRGRDLLPPELSRATVDMTGHRSRSPVLVGVRSAAGPEGIPTETYLFVWLAAGEPLLDGEQRAPAECVLFSVRVSRNGMELAEDVSSYIPEVQKRLTAIQLSSDRASDLVLPFGVVIAVGTGGNDSHCARSAEEAAGTRPDTRDRTPPAWPAIVCEEAVDQFFESARAVMAQTGIDSATGRQHFDAAIGMRSDPVPLVAVSSEELEQSGFGADENGRWFREDLPFYIGCSLLIRIAPDTKKRTVIALQDMTSDAALDAGPSARYELQDRLQAAGRLRIQRDTAAAFLKFLLEVDAGGGEPESVVQEPGQLPAWLQEPLRSAVASRMRPVAYVGRSGNGELMLLAFTQRGGDLILSLWVIDGSGRAERMLERIVLADPNRERPRGEHAHIQPLFQWNLASALHSDSFNQELQKLEPAANLSGEQLWQRLRREREAFPETSTRPLDEKEYQQLRRQLEKRRAGIALPAKPGMHGVHLWASDKSFYEGCPVYTVEAGQRRARFVTDPRAGMEREWPVILTGTSPRMYRVNRLLRNAGKLHIHAENSPEYLRFFCNELHTELGVFKIVDRIEDLDWRFLTVQVRRALEPLLWPVTRIYSEPDGGAFVLAALVSYGRDLSIALFRVMTRGKRLPSGGIGFGFVEMLADATLLSDLPIHPQGHDPDLDTAFEVLA